jgi:hypothetical protein
MSRSYVPRPDLSRVERPIIGPGEFAHFALMAFGWRGGPEHDRARPACLRADGPSLKDHRPYLSL